MVEVMEVYVPADLYTDFHTSFVPVISFRSDLCFSFSFMLHFPTFSTSCNFAETTELHLMH